MTSRIPLTLANVKDVIADTPKLKKVSRWVDRAVAESGDKCAGVVWIDDVHGRDAIEWVAACNFPVLLVTVQAQRGLTAKDVDRVRSWAGELIK